MRIEVEARKGARLIGRPVCPVRVVDGVEQAYFRGTWWPLSDGTIDISQTVQAEVTSSPQAEGRDSAQDAIISAEPDARIAVAAGPGTGKTWVACQRVASLIENGVPPSRIWIVSFTRTAVLEIRQRIAAALDEPGDAASVRIATLDSHAWALQSGFSETAALSGSFDENIARAADMLGNDGDAADYLGRLRHLVIDEGQDIIGTRADLIVAIVEGAGDRCGVTAFLDEAQAIYDFTEESRRPGSPGTTLGGRLHQLGFQQLSLSRVHRTDCPKLRTIFRDVREDVLNPALRSGKRTERVREEIVRLAHGDAGEARSLELHAAPADSLILFRRRAEVLERSSWAGDTPHRLRMSGLPPRIRPWLAAMFWDYTDVRLVRSRFETLWLARVSGEIVQGAPGPETAWALLEEVAGEGGGVVDMARLRGALARQSPPILFCSPEFGDTGPVLGTIHASKGREADDVFLFMPPVRPDEEDPDQETRVLFVGATRARRKLSVGRSGRSYASATPSGRVWSHRKGAGRVEIGRAGDVEAKGLVGQKAFATADEAGAAQEAWRSQPLRSGLLGRAVGELGWLHEILGAGDMRLATLSDAVKTDLWHIARAMKAERSPYLLPYIRSMGVASLVLRSDDPCLENLHEPWRSSGFIMAPMLLGFSSFRIGNS